ncbi:uncharacterized protein IWZ02DRAFT_487805 [Phyllosticta citriasiana]|uniref:BTB domain-containing protein n=1 Tax=Phyllosticta citriasiana TaxID=595635 RepID=A0ABR1KTG2_9PEZI
MATSKKRVVEINHQPVGLKCDNGDDKTALDGHRFSDDLRHRIIKFVVRGTEFYIHEDLLCRESEKFEKQLRGNFKEARTGEITDCEEDPVLMRVFFEYLYRDDWLLEENITSPSLLVALARLYCLADRLGARSFQDSVFWKFAQMFRRAGLPENKEICELLLLIHTELPERKDNEYRLRKAVLWCAASQLSRLKTYSEFKDHILRDHPDLGCQILLWAGNSDVAILKTKKPAPRFKQEMEFLLS